MLKKANFKYKKETYYHRDLVMASISGNNTVARLYIESSDRAYLCQNYTSGSRPHDGNTFEYKYGWVFDVVSSSHLGAEVKIYKKLKDNGSIPDYFIKEDNRTLSVVMADNSFKFEITRTDYPSCCGASILHNYKISYVKFPKQEIIIHCIDNFVKLSPMNNLIVVDGDAGHRFFTKYLGFTEDKSFINWNDGGADLIMLSYINIKEDYEHDNYDDDEEHDDDPFS